MIPIEKKTAAYVLISFALLAAIVIWVKGCDKTPIVDPRAKEKEEYEQKIRDHEKIIFEDSIIITYSNRKYRDSLRELLNPK